MWMKLYSDAFLNDSYLKYVGWTMHDKVPFSSDSSLLLLLVNLPTVGLNMFFTCVFKKKKKKKFEYPALFLT